MSCWISTRAADGARGPPAPALEELVAWVLPVAEELGDRLVPRGAGRERRRAPDRPPRGRARRSREIYAEQVARTRDVAMEATRG